jgi:hypothetical protein
VKVSFFTVNMLLAMSLYLQRGQKATKTRLVWINAWLCMVFSQRQSISEVLQSILNGVFGTQRRPYLVIDHDDFTLCFYWSIDQKKLFGGCFEQVRLVAKGNGSHVGFKYVFGGGFLLHTPHQFWWDQVHLTQVGHGYNRTEQFFISLFNQ